MPISKYKRENQKMNKSTLIIIGTLLVCTLFFGWLVKSSVDNISGSINKRQSAMNEILKEMR